MKKDRRIDAARRETEVKDTDDQVSIAGVDAEVAAEKKTRRGVPPYVFSLNEDPLTNDHLFQWDIAATLSSVFESVLPPKGPVIQKKPKDCVRHTLVLDMDETLVYSQLGDSPSDLSLRFDHEGFDCSVAVTFRPHLQHFLKFVSSHFEVVLFTAAEKNYAEKVLDSIDPTGTIFRYRLFRNSCVFVKGKYVKDLRVLGRDLARTVVLDDSPISYAFHADNAVPIIPWRGDKTDETLPMVAAFLRTLLDETDARPTLRSTFEVRQILGRRR